MSIVVKDTVNKAITLSACAHAAIIIGSLFTDCHVSTYVYVLAALLHVYTPKFVFDNIEILTFDESKQKIEESMRAIFAAREKYIKNLLRQGVSEDNLDDGVKALDYKEHDSAMSKLGNIRRWFAWTSLLS